MKEIIKEMLLFIFFIMVVSIFIITFMNSFIINEERELDNQEEFNFTLCKEYQELNLIMQRINGTYEDREVKLLRDWYKIKELKQNCLGMN